MMYKTKKISVVIPCYKVKKHIVKVVSSIPDFVDMIIVVDDHCPENSVDHLLKNISSTNIFPVRNPINLGVGGAVKNGYLKSVELGAEIIVKIDGDGQMDLNYLKSLLFPIATDQADYTKGNRFWSLDMLEQMPKVRVFGNAVLSFFNKISSGYWNINDPTNGYTAINSKVIKFLQLEKISNRYFFESDVLFRLGIIKAKVCDIPMPSKYGDEISGLKIKSIVHDFLWKHARNTFKRIFYNYYLREMSTASLELPIGILLMVFGASFGINMWHNSLVNYEPATSGTVMLAALPIIIGFQLLLAFLNFDISSVPETAIAQRIEDLS